LFGAVVGKTVNDNGGVNLHYDRSVSDRFYIVGSFA
jgi:hypothetical protein